MIQQDWKADCERALVAALSRSFETLKSQPLLRLDIGVFPWHGQIEISFLLLSDVENNICKRNDIAAWPHYNASAMQDGRWPEVARLCSEMRKTWEAGTGSAPEYFEAVAQIMKSPQVSAIVSKFNRTSNFQVTLYDPDGPVINYCP